MTVIEAIKAIDWKKPQSIVTAITLIGGVAASVTGYIDPELTKNIGEAVGKFWSEGLALGSLIGLWNLGTETK